MPRCDGHALVDEELEALAIRRLCARPMGYKWRVATSMRAGLRRAAMAVASALMLVIACANDVESRGQPR